MEVYKITYKTLDKHEEIWNLQIGFEVSQEIWFTFESLGDLGNGKLPNFWKTIDLFSRHMLNDNSNIVNEI